MALVVSEKLQGRYEVVRSIKSGGMGAVYEAIDHKLASTPCAIKEVLTSALQGSSGAYVLQSFESEMRALAGLEHPNIPRVRDYFEIDGRRYIILDLVQGQALDDELAEHLRLTNAAMEPAVAAVDMVQVLETLTYLHNCQPPIIHRDIKSANLIRDSRTGRIKLVDFGIARSVETQKVQTQVGTPGFCAPEQMGGRAEVRSDIYSVGATLYHLCTGRVPPAFTFDALDMDLSRSPGLVKIVLKATAPKPSERYATAEEMARALRAWLRKEGSTKIDPATLPQTPQGTKINPLASTPLPSNSQHGLWVAVAVMLLAALGLLYNDYASRFGKPTSTAKTSSVVVHPSPVWQDNKKLAAEIEKSRAKAEAQAREREAQLRAARAEEAKRESAERARLERERQAREVAATNNQRPALLPDGNYPHRSFQRREKRSVLENLPERFLGLPRIWANPRHDTAFYSGEVSKHRVHLTITSFPGQNAYQLRQIHAELIAGMREDGGQERAPGEFCGFRREGGTLHGVRMKEGLLYDLRISPPPPNGFDWGPFSRLIDQRLD